jgi:hypothetical protein
LGSRGAAAAAAAPAIRRYDGDRPANEAASSIKPYVLRCGCGCTLCAAPGKNVAIYARHKPYTVCGFLLILLERGHKANVFLAGEIDDIIEKPQRD